jgi:hypothetical protein
MWCIGALTQEYRSRLYALLELYARPMSRDEPVICIDEKSLQLIGHSRAPLPMNSCSPAKVDYEYVRNGTTNLFVAVEPKAGQRIVSVTERRGKIDLVAFIGELLTNAYAKARRVHLVLDNLNTHFRKCFDDVLGSRAATNLAPSPVPLHTQARELAEHGEDRDRHPQSSMPGPAIRKSTTPSRRSRRVATGAQRCTADHRVDVHPPGRRSEAKAPRKNNLIKFRRCVLKRNAGCVRNRAD